MHESEKAESKQRESYGEAGEEDEVKKERNTGFHGVRSRELEQREKGRREGWPGSLGTFLLQEPVGCFNFTK